MSLERKIRQLGRETVNTEEVPHDTAEAGATGNVASEGADLDNLTEEELIEYAKKLSLE